MNRKTRTKSDVYAEIKPAVEQAINSTSRRWPGVDRDDLTSAAWCVAVEALAGFDPAKGDSRVRYISATLARALPREARRLLSPVHLPKNREYQHSMDDVGKKTGVTADAALLVPTAEYDPEMALSLRRLHEAVRAAVESVTDDPALRSALLSGGTIKPRHLAEMLGGTPLQWQRETRRLYEDLRYAVPARLCREL
jgi:hypothetical protein